MRTASTMPLAVLWLLSAAAPALPREVAIAARGASDGRGILIRAGGRAGEDSSVVDPPRPTVVLVHGLNPFHPWLHYEYGEPYAAAVARRSGTGPDVLAWDWNAATLPGFRLRTLDRNAIDQGRRLAGALLRAGVDPGRLHLVGHSHGGLVAASAARTLRERTGRATATLTLIDPIPAHHRILFEQLAATTSARRVEHIYAGGPSGFGREVRYPGVANTRLPARSGALGYLRPLHVDHLNAMRAYIESAGDGRLNAGD